ncbi:MAG: hypothetical protein UY07_C0016G0004 [Parcubacteria group bacterium GW2011_GWA1_47_8]|nr:MAG: hypothetical protein UY07_C0016G0004 [Parcubacteria group bacterium GW2011_GWA1_47_8]KKW07701.1 MAG: hypothetical protein UY42_C0008G0004 [Parcubacteria group bacterium GW2011_GWA2_49_16]
MSIKDFTKKIKGLGRTVRPRPIRIRELQDDLFLGLIIILVAFGAFGLGRLSKIEGAKTPIYIENAPTVTADTFATASSTAAPSLNVPATSSTQLMGSKNGKKYYYPWCAGANRIADANRIYFTSKADAESRGYTPSSTCNGL